jgi:hypothetical protein
MEDETFPGKYSWRRWSLTHWFGGQLYVSGLTRCGTTSSHSQRDPHGRDPRTFYVYTLPSWKHVLPKRGGRLRPYILWLPNWWWECQISQGFKIKGRHRPLSPVALGICAACAPCPDCGQPYCGPECVWSPV